MLYSTIPQNGETSTELKYAYAGAGRSGGLPTRPTRPGLGAPKAQGPPRLRGPKVGDLPKARGPPRLGGHKVGDPQGLPAQWPQRAGVHKAWKSPRVGAPRIGGPHGFGAPMGWGPLWVWGTQGLGPPMGWRPQRVSGHVYETKPIIAVFCFLWIRFVSFKECSLKKQSSVAVLSSYP
jgi:hypothetical protein